MKRSAPIARKRVKPRRTTTPRCSTGRCKKPAKIAGYCQSHATTQADRMFSRWMRDTHGPCWNCGADTSLQWAHVHSRRYRAIRWSVKNSTVLCASCHTRYTHNPAAWEQWCRDHNIPWDSLRLSALHDPPQDPGEIIDWLQKGEGP